MIDDETKAIAINFSMQIELGNLDLKIVLEEIRKNKIFWIPVLKFMENFDKMTKSAINRLYLESRYLRSFY